MGILFLRLFIINIIFTMFVFFVRSLCYTLYTYLHKKEHYYWEFFPKTILTTVEKNDSYQKNFIKIFLIHFHIYVIHHDVTLLFTIAFHMHIYFISWIFTKYLMYNIIFYLKKCILDLRTREGTYAVGFTMKYFFSVNNFLRDENNINFKTVALL